MTGPRRRPALARAFLLCALAAPASADGVGTLCDRWGHTSGRCACAAEALAAELPRDDFALYHGVGTDTGRGMGWEAAIAAAAARIAGDPDRTRRRVEAARRAHRALIRLCTN